MEEEIRQRELLQILLASELPQARSSLDLNDLVLFAVGGIRLDGTQDLEGLGDTLLQLWEGGFGVWERDGGVAAQAHGEAFGAVGGALDLSGEGVHVGD